MTPDAAAVNRWLLDLLGDEPGDFLVGDHQAPITDPDEVLAYPYWVLWHIGGGGVDGPPLGASSADAAFVFQLDSVGKTREQTVQLATRGRERVVGRTAAGAYAAPKSSPSGIVILDRFLDGAPGAPLAEGDRPNEVWTHSERYIITVSAQT